MDWRAVLTAGNAWYDRMVRALKIEDRQERIRAYEKLEQEIRELRRQSVDTAHLEELLLSDTSPHEEIGKSVGGLLAGIFVPAYGKAQKSLDRTQLIDRLGQVAFALEAYHSDRSSYPDKLHDLVPDYLAAIPDDRHEGESLSYRRTEDGYLLRNVGENDKNDGSASEQPLSNDDLSVRMPLPELPMRLRTFRQRPRPPEAPTWKVALVVAGGVVVAVVFPLGLLWTRRRRPLSQQSSNAIQELSDNGLRRLNKSLLLRVALALAAGAASAAAASVVLVAWWHKMVKFSDDFANITAIGIGCLVAGMALFWACRGIAREFTIAILVAPLIAVGTAGIVFGPGRLVASLTQPNALAGPPLNLELATGHVAPGLGFLAGGVVLLIYLWPRDRMSISGDAAMVDGRATKAWPQGVQWLVPGIIAVVIGAGTGLCWAGVSYVVTHDVIPPDNLEDYSGTACGFTTAGVILLLACVTCNSRPRIWPLFIAVFLVPGVVFWCLVARAWAMPSRDSNRRSA